MGAMGAGTDYLARRARPPEIAPLLEALSTVVTATRIERGRTADVLATVYHLITRGAEGEYRQRLENARPLLANIAMYVTGPSPCHAFASAI
jgi:hypothetical protein